MKSERMRKQRTMMIGKKANNRRKNKYSLCELAICQVKTAIFVRLEYVRCASRAFLHMHHELRYFSIIQFIYYFGK